VIKGFRPLIQRTTAGGEKHRDLLRRVRGRQSDTAEPCWWPGHAATLLAQGVVGGSVEPGVARRCRRQASVRAPRKAGSRGLSDGTQSGPCLTAPRPCAACGQHQTCPGCCRLEQWGWQRAPGLAARAGSVCACPGSDRVCSGSAANSACSGRASLPQLTALTAVPYPTLPYAADTVPCRRAQPCPATLGPARRRATRTCSSWPTERCFTRRSPSSCRRAPAFASPLLARLQSSRGGRAGFVHAAAGEQGAMRHAWSAEFSPRTAAHTGCIGQSMRSLG